MTLQQAGRAVTSAQRNLELLLLLGAVAFAVVAWRALESAGSPMPGESRAILTQFLLVAAIGHLGLRVLAPSARAQPYACSMVLAAIGLVMVTRLEPGVATDQVNWITVGVVGMLAVVALRSQVPTLRTLQYTAAAAAVALLFITGVFGTTINGARLWVTVAGQTIQTTELIKLLLLVFLAGYLADRADILGSPRVRFAGRTYSTTPYLIPLALTWGFTILALAWLKDLGAIALLLMLGVTALYVATGRARYLAGGMLILLLTAALGYWAFDHAQLRIDTWLDPFGDAQAAGYQTVQSLYAFEAGGVTGEGLGMGMPDVIPAAHTDYIFASIGEELGMTGALAVALIFTVLTVSLFRIAGEARNDFESYLAAFVGLLFAIQATIIMAGNLRLIPTTGITLPFVSYGGSSLVVNFLLLGLALAVSARSDTARSSG